MSERRCILEQAIGRSVRCSCSECPFWEEGGAVLQPGCLLGRLLPGEDWTPELAERWLTLRPHISDLPRPGIRL